MSTYDDLLTAKTPDQLFAENLAALEGAGVDVAGFGDFSMNRALPYVQARALAREQVLRVALVNFGWLSTATGAALDRLALELFDEERLPALPAVWDLAVSMAAGSSVVTISPVSRKITAAATNGTLFQNINPTTRVIGPGGQAIVRFEALTKGVVGNVNSGDITSLIAKPAGMSVTNAPPGALITAGRDQETDAEFRARCRGKWAARFGAAWSRLAMDYRIPTAAPTVTRWRVDDANPHGAGTVELILANASGPATVGECNAVLADVGSSSVKALGSGALTVIPATVETVTVSGTLTCSGATLALAKAALDQFASRRNVGESTTIDLGFLLGVLTGGAYPAYGLDGFAGVTGSNITAPAADVSGLGINSIIAFNYGGLTAI